MCKTAVQLVLLGAGMDSRAYRMEGIADARVFEVDQQTTFDVKEPLLHYDPLKVRHAFAPCSRDVHAQL